VEENGDIDKLLMGETTGGEKQSERMKHPVAKNSPAVANQILPTLETRELSTVNFLK